MTVQLKIQYLKHYQSNWERLHYKHQDDSGFDLRAAISDTLILKAHEIKLIPCGIKIEISHNNETPYFYELQIRARSGLAAKHGIGVANGPGTVDFGYRGEIMVPLINFSDNDFTIEPGDRIAQGIICPVIQALITTTDCVSDNSERGNGGFGSTGCQ
ncbi:MAG: dUTP diphosphatase [Alphaproteobacteria bacterium]|nr:dUTP diphosphatase [Alphaproteobacteria bacterium]MBQ9089979.1 dUTP diphosphatase [Alphaproteobacteria bacterium]